MKIYQAQTAQHIREVQLLFREYESSLEVDLCFQGFAEELAGLPGKYVPPQGALLAAEVGGVMAGCAGLRRIAEHACEMKRLYVRPEYRGKSIGGLLADNIIDLARAAGYETMFLDTLSIMENALSLYRSRGFRETEPYYPNPLAGALYLQLDLRT